MDDGLIKPNHIIMFGAGASAYSSANLAQNPPLGNRLLEAMHMQSSMAEMLLKNKYYKWLFSTVGFELAMEIAASDESLPKNFIATFQRDICAFLSNFYIDSNNTYLRLIEGLPRDSKKVGFVSLNYDTLLEQALRRTQLCYYQHSSEYVLESLPLIKPHGSCSFLPDTSNLNMRGTTVRGLCQVIDNGRTDIAVEGVDIKRWLYDPRNLDLCPVISYYARGKKTYCNGSFIDGIREIYDSIILNCETLNIVGVKYTEHDAHIWDVINRSSCRINLVEPNQININEFRQKFGRRLNHVGNTFEQSIDTLHGIINT